LPTNGVAQQTPAATPQSGSTTPAATTASKAPAKTASTAAKTAAPLTLKTQKQKFSYAVGMMTAANLKRQSISVDPNIFARGVKDALAGGKTLLTDDEAREVMIAERQAQMQEAAAPNKKEGAAFLAANKTKEGVVTLPDGLQYKILQAGNGPKPAASDTVKVNYRGTLLNGTEFDSSYKRNQPTTFPVNRVIKGWTEALQLMPVGSKWQLFIPSDLAYGDPGNGGIPPGSTLIFEVELLSIENQGEKK